MTTCPACGAQNDPSNRFCDQCGTRLEVSGGQQAADAASLPTAAASTCPSCGAVVLPGEAFCDSCGAALQPTVAAAPADAPTVFAPPSAPFSPPSTPSTPAPVVSPPVQPASPTVACPMCGHQNVPGDRFCENCGASLQAPAPAASPTDATVLAPSGFSTAAIAPAVEPPPPAAEAPTPVPIVVEAAPVIADVPAAPPVEAAPAEAPVPVAVESPPPTPTPDPVPVAVEAAPAVDTQAIYEAERTRLEGAVVAQRQVVTQLEQTQAVLGALTPPAILQAIADARSALAQAEADLQNLAPPAPAIDPAEVARLEGAVAAQRQVVTQLEQTQAVLGALTPPAILQAIADARSALDQAEADLQNLVGGSTPATVAPVAAVVTPEPVAPPPVAPVVAPDPAPVVPVAAEPVVAVPPPLPVAPPPPPPPAPRLVLAEGSAEIPLPTDRSEIIIGREDPISQIFPEIDLTPYGGESGGVSRQHARINHTNGQWTLTDLNSTNYTRVDGQKIEPNKPVPISDGTKVQFGRIAAVFHA